MSYINLWYNLTVFFGYIQTNLLSIVKGVFKRTSLVPLHQLTNTPTPPIDPQTIKPTEVDYSDLYKEDLKPFAGYLRTYDDVPLASKWAHLANSQLLEYTPLGNVLMYYDADKDAFVYYSDRVLPYGFIETVARRYVIKNNCTKLYLDITSPSSRSQKETVVSGMSDGTKEPPNGGVFAKFKSYNAPKTVAIKQTQQKINRYTYGGKIANFMFLKKPPKKTTLSYSEFKTKRKSL
jgi:hypothetical protein